MNRNPLHRTLAAIAAAIAAAAVMILLTLPADAAASAYTCRWTVNYGTTPRTAVMRCTNGYSRAYQWSDRHNRWVPVHTVPAGR